MSENIFRRHERKTEEAIESQTSGKPTPPVSASTSGPKFEKSFTPEQRKQQQEKLAELLRKREF